MNKQLQLFIFPYAGGSLHNFRHLIEHIDNRIKVEFIEYSGRGSRNRESFCKTFEDLIAYVSEYIFKKRDYKESESILK